MISVKDLNQPENNLSIRLGAIWILIATSSVVLIEPAPYDVIAITLMFAFFAMGLRIPPHLSTPLVLLTIFMLANVLSAMFSVDPFRCLRYMAITFFLILTWLFFTSIIYENPKPVYDIIWSAYLFSAVIAVICGIVGYLRLTPYYDLFLSWDRVKGPFKDPNVYAPFLIPPVLYLVFRLERANFSQFVFSLALLLFLTIGILLSFSRGAWFNLAVSTFIYVGFRLVTARSTKELSGLAIVGCIVMVASISAVIWALSTTEIAEIFFQRASLTQEYDVGEGGRFDTLRRVIEQIFQKPLGIGPGESAYTFDLDPHNLYIHITFETGWLGGISFCGFLIMTVWQGLLFALTDSRLQGAFIVVFSCVLGTLIESMIIHSTHWRHLYLLLAMMWGVLIAREKLVDRVYP